MNKEIKYIDRYNKEHIFILQSDNIIKWSWDGKYYRTSYNSENQCVMVDPDGGPFLSEKTDMGIISPKLSGMIIDYFLSDDNGFYQIVCKK